MFSAHLPRHLRYELKYFITFIFLRRLVELKKNAKFFFHTWALRPKRFRTSNLIKRGIHNLALLQKVSNEQKISSLISGFIFGFIMSGTYFGHFRHQGVKIFKCNKLIFCSKLTKELNEYNRNCSFSTFLSFFREQDNSKWISAQKNIVINFSGFHRMSVGSF